MTDMNEDARDNYLDVNGFRIKARIKENSERDERPRDADWNKRKHNKRKPKRGDKREY